MRFGVVRYPPRGVPKTEWGTGDWFDVWLPNLAPSGDLLRWWRDKGGDERWPRFEQRYRKELRGEPRHVIAALAGLSRQCSFSVGCYCADQSRCHRSILRAVLMEAGADVV
jgi:uncharacterized protein YeaO (DUF488 family)